MRVLFVYKEKNGDNLFVPVIRTRLSVHGIEAISSVDEFWNPSRSYDIIHIHWPEEVVGWNVNDVDIDKRLETRLRYFKEKGSRFIIRATTYPLIMEVLCIKLAIEW